MAELTHTHEMFDCHIRLTLETDKAIGVVMDGEKDVTWLPRSKIVEFNRWNHEGQTYVRLRMPLWIAKAKGFDLSCDVMGRYSEARS